MNHKLVKNTTWLYLMTIAQIVLPFITFPYLTRVLSLEAYGTVAYVKSTLVYVQLLINFGFELSAVRDIVQLHGDKKSIGILTGEVLTARLMLAGVGLAVMGVFCAAVPLLHSFILFAMLSFAGTALNVFLIEFFFRGIEQMQVLTIRYVLMKSITTVLTFLCIKGDSDLLMMPVLDIIGTAAAIAMTFAQVRKFGYRVCPAWPGAAWSHLKKSFVYFISNFATSVYTALNTLVIGIMLSPADVAFWSVAATLIGGAQAFYSPILNALYPHMCATKQRRLILKVLALCMPPIVIASIGTYAFAEPIMAIIGGQKYVAAMPTFRLLVPVLVLSFPAMLFGWPTLGAIGKAKETSMTTIASGLCQMLGLGALIGLGQCTLLNICILRCTSEFVLLAGRYGMYRRFIREFN